MLGIVFGVAWKYSENNSRWLEYFFSFEHMFYYYAVLAKQKIFREQKYFCLPRASLSRQSLLPVLLYSPVTVFTNFGILAYSWVFCLLWRFFMDAIDEMPMDVYGWCQCLFLGSVAIGQGSCLFTSEAASKDFKVKGCIRLTRAFSLCNVCLMACQTRLQTFRGKDLQANSC